MSNENTNFPNYTISNKGIQKGNLKKEEAFQKSLKIIESFNEELNKEKSNQKQRESAKRKSPQKIKKQEMRKKTITKIKITIAIITMAVGALAAKQFVKINQGKEALRIMGTDALPRDKYSINEGSNGYTVANIKTNQEATYGDYIAAVKENAIEKDIDPISVYLAVEDEVSKIAAKDAVGKEYTTKEIADRALEYIDSLEESQSKGKGR